MCFIDKSISSVLPLTISLVVWDVTPSSVVSVVSDGFDIVPEENRLSLYWSSLEVSEAATGIEVFGEETCMELVAQIPGFRGINILGEGDSKLRVDFIG